ncbi:hypothetical protein P8C59_009110 [Phyllachora maydis]|uniref:beta-glucosidase n=1 Tax=Phyllachora maydis TaxID=1825666 RepID=A0AAD9MHW4_9PEZI|nr:hypothetical protein P8C59_009110 [Phyllachora maydis]
MGRDESQEALLARRSTEHRQGYRDERQDASSDTRRSSHSDSDIEDIEFLDHDPLTSVAALETKAAFLDGKRRRRPCTGCSRCCIFFLATAALICFLLVAASGGYIYKKYQNGPPYGESPPWYPSPKGGIAASWAQSYEKAAQMVGKMTLAEKVNVTTGTGWQMGLAVGTNGPASLVGFPQLQLQDGPLGLRFADNATAFPAGITVGATWNKTLMYARGKALGAEARQKGINALLGPCVGPLGRMPAGGRNWECFGADPYLQGVAGAQTIRGVQSEGVMATIKHFVANEQEHYRQPWEWGLPHAISANLDDRTLHELYAWPFGDAVKAGVAAVMCSYNMVNNSYACSNSKLLNGILKDELGFQGFVVSDWLAQHAGVASALAGLDMTMPGDGLGWADGQSLWGPQLTKAVLNGSVPIERLDDMVTRIVAAWFQLGQDDEAKFPRNKPPNFSSWTNDRLGVVSPGSPSAQETVEVNQFVKVQSPEHTAISRQVAAEGIVLLKNDDTLPLSRRGWINAKPKSKRHGQRHRRVVVFGEDAGPGQGPNYCQDRACNQGTLGSGWGSGAVEFPYLISPIEALRSQFDPTGVELLEYLTNDPPFARDKDMLDDAEFCLVFANADAGEGFAAWGSVKGDRPDLKLQKDGDALIAQAAAHCGEGSSDVVVVIHTVGPVLVESWIDIPNVKAVLVAHLPGQESGNALADVLFGDVNPSGRLPYTMGKSLKDYGPGAEVMYLPNGVLPQQDFDEGLYIDYRHFDKYDVAPRYEFGFGLSYTTFEITKPTVVSVKAKTALPSARPGPGAAPPAYPTSMPPAREALFPDDFGPLLDKYVYPYLHSIDGNVTNVTDPYPYPEGYHDVQTPSGAGGDEGGNPDLWDTYVRVQADVRNTGEKGGATVAQLYMSYPQQGSKVDFPVKVLRGFEKVYLDAGQTTTVEFNLTRRDLSYWDVEAQNWVMVVEGEYNFLVGQSSKDLKAVVTW